VRTTSSPHYAAPLVVARHRRAGLFEAFSPKLGQRVRLFDHTHFQQWVRLKADPDLVESCEYLARLGSAPQAHLIDFWVLRHEGERFLLIDNSEPTCQ
jgi:hypothetical protein